MTYEIKALNEDGSGYLVITLDDDSTFGQRFQSMPMEDPDKFDATADALVDSVVTKHEATTAPKDRLPEVLAKVGTVRTVTRKTRSAVVEEK